MNKIESGPHISANTVAVMMEIFTSAWLVTELVRYNTSYTKYLALAADATQAHSLVRGEIGNDLFTSGGVLAFIIIAHLGYNLLKKPY